MQVLPWSSLFRDDIVMNEVSQSRVASREYLYPVYLNSITSTRGFRNFDSCLRIFYTVLLPVDSIFLNLQVVVQSTKYPHCTLHTAHCTLHTAHCTPFYSTDTVPTSYLFDVRRSTCFFSPVLFALRTWVRIKDGNVRFKAVRFLKVLILRRQIKVLKF